MTSIFPSLHISEVSSVPITLDNRNYCIKHSQYHTYIYIYKRRSGKYRNTGLSIEPAHLWHNNMQLFFPWFFPSRSNNFLLGCCSFCPWNLWTFSQELFWCEDSTVFSQLLSYLQYKVIKCHFSINPFPASVLLIWHGSDNKLPASY